MNHWLFRAGKALLFLVLCGAALSAPAAESDQNRLLVVGDLYCPYTCDPQRGPPGYAVELLQAIFEPRGYEIEYQVLPWSRAQLGVRNQLYSIAIGSSNETHSGLVFPAEPLGYISNHFVVRTESRWRYRGPASLDEISLGFVEGYDYGETLNRFLDQDRAASRLQPLTGEDATERILGMLQRGRIDAFIEDKGVAFYLARQLGIRDQLTEAGREGNPIVLFPGFAKNSPRTAAYMRLYDEGIRSMRQNGRLEALLQRYGLQDWCRAELPGC